MTVTTLILLYCPTNLVMRLAARLSTVATRAFLQSLYYYVSNAYCCTGLYTSINVQYNLAQSQRIVHTGSYPGVASMDPLSGIKGFCEMINAV